MSSTGTFRIVPALTLLVLFFGCTEEIPGVFVIPDRAKRSDYVRFRGANYLSLKINESYPAPKTIQAISQTLKERGWEPLKEAFLHPETPSSIVVGWTFYEDKSANSFIYEWAVDWKDPGNNILSYSLKYTDRIEKYRQKTFMLKPNTTELTVVAVYMPEKVALARRKDEAEPKKQ